MIHGAFVGSAVVLGLVLAATATFATTASCALRVVFTSFTFVAPSTARASTSGASTTVAIDKLRSVATEAALWVL